jgi:hypothetical protein
MLVNLFTQIGRLTKDGAGTIKEETESKGGGEFAVLRNREESPVNSQHRTTLVPDLNGRSSAVQFLEDYDQVSRDLMVSLDENRSLTEQLMQATNMAQVLSRDLDQQRTLTQRESARANMWLGYTMKLIGQLETIRASIDSAKAIGQDAAREAAEYGLNDEAGRDDQQGLAEVVNGMTPRATTTTAPPLNRLTT